MTERPGESQQADSPAAATIAGCGVVPYFGPVEIVWVPAGVELALPRIAYSSTEKAAANHLIADVLAGIDKGRPITDQPQP